MKIRKIIEALIQLLPKKDDLGSKRNSVWKFIDAQRWIVIRNIFATAGEIIEAERWSLFGNLIDD